MFQLYAAALPSSEGPPLQFTHLSEFYLSKKMDHTNIKVYYSLCKSCMNFFVIHNVFFQAGIKHPNHLVTHRIDGLAERPAFSP